MFKWSSPLCHHQVFCREVSCSASGSLCVLAQCVVLKLCLKEELLWALGTVINFIFLSMDCKDVLLQFIRLHKNCETNRAFECASHPLKAVLNQVTQELCRRVKHLVTQLALMIDAFLNHMVSDMDLYLSLILKGHLALDALIGLFPGNRRRLGTLPLATGLRRQVSVVNLNVALQVFSTFKFDTTLRAPQTATRSLVHFLWGQA